MFFFATCRYCRLAVVKRIILKKKARGVLIIGPGTIEFYLFLLIVSSAFLFRRLSTVINNVIALCYHYYGI